MLSRISSTLHSALNMMVDRGLMKLSIRVMSLVAVLKLMLVDERLWTQMLFRGKIEIIVRVRSNRSWLEMNCLMNSCISWHLRMFCSKVVTMVTILIFIAFHNLVLIRSLFGI